jgi:hypothetical protein
MVPVKPATVIEWHRKGFRFYWRWRSRRPGRPRISPEARDLIRRMSNANRLWGAPRVHGELLKLGIAISQATVGRWMPWRPKIPPDLAEHSAHPEHEPAHVLAELKREMGPIAFSAKYQQGPVPPGGTIIKCKWLKPYDTVTHQFSDRIIISWDIAFRGQGRACARQTQGCLRVQV